MALRTRAAVFGVDTGIDTSEIARTSRLVSACTGVYMPPNKAIVGGNAFAHEAGIHQDGVLKHRATYEIMIPESIGLDGSMLVLGKHSGRRAVRQRLESLGYVLDDEQLRSVFDRFKELADRKKVIDERDLVVLVEGAFDRPPERYELTQVQASCGTHAIPTATVRLRGPDGDTHTTSATGTGPVDAVCRAINAVVGNVGELRDYRVNAVTEGIGAMGEVTIRVTDFHTGHVFVGHGAHTDIVAASAEAYVAALNRLLAARTSRAIVTPAHVAIPVEIGS
jgi:2-isopropylmalate synthase